MQCLKKNISRSSLNQAPRRHRAVSRASTYVPPSQAPGGSALESLAQYTQCVPDVFPGGPVKAAAATVNVSVISQILSSESLGLKQAENAIVTAVNYDKCQGLSGDAKLTCQIQKALVNVGSLFASEIDSKGRVCTELDAKLSNDADGLVDQGMKIVSMYKDNGVPVERLILRLPATWAGIEAVKKLEKNGVATQVFLVYSFAQGVAAAQAGASVILANVGRTNDWYARNPNVPKDPKGPREDSGFKSELNVGVKLVNDLYTYCQKYHPKSKIMASGVRTSNEAMALRGVDYMVLPRSVMSELEAAPTLSGYNDGLSSSGAADDSTLQPVMSKAIADATDMAEHPAMTKDAFNDQLGLCGAELLRAGLDLKLAEEQRVAPFFSKTTTMSSNL